MPAQLTSTPSLSRQRIRGVGQEEGIAQVHVVIQVRHGHLRRVAGWRAEVLIVSQWGARIAERRRLLKWLNRRPRRRLSRTAVSYTHLTLPTICSV
eukprot:6414613-Alexandrium_andersonii.AAC.1